MRNSLFSKLIFSLFIVLLSSCNTTRTDNIRTQELASKGDYQKALENAKKSLQKAILSLGENHVDIAKSYDNIANINIKLGNFDKAEEQLKKSLKIRKNKLSPNDAKIAVSLNNLGALYKQTGKLKKASKLLIQSVEIMKKTKGSRDPEVALGSINLAHLYLKLNKYKKAEQTLKKAIGILSYKKSGFDNETATARAYLAEAYQAQGLFKKAEEEIKKNLTKQLSKFSAEHPNIGKTLNSLALIYAKQGKYKLAEQNLSRSLEILENKLGSYHPLVALSLRNYTEILIKLGKYDKAVPLIKRAEEIQTKSLSKNHPDIASTKMTLAKIYYSAGKYDKALAQAQKALEIQEKIYGKNNIVVAKTYSTIGEINRKLKNLNQSEQSLKKAISVSNNLLGENHPETAIIKKNLASLYVDKNLFFKAEKLYKKSAIIIKGAYGNNHPLVISLYHSLAKLFIKQGSNIEALTNIRKASESFIEFTKLAGVNEASQSYKMAQNIFDSYLTILANSIQRSPRNEGKYSEEAFRVFQMAQTTGTSQALSKMAARFASNSDYLGSIIRKQDILTKKYNQTKEELLKTVSISEGLRNRSAEKSFRKQMEEIKKQKQSLEKTIKRKFPKYSKLISPTPFSIYNMQKKLSRNEAIVAYYVGNKQTFVFAATNDKMKFARAYITKEELSKKVKALRKGLDPKFIGSNGDIPLFDTVASYNLYNKIFAPVKNILKNKKDLTIIPNKALESIPFGVLVTKNMQAKTILDYKNTKWLLDDYSITVVPSISSVRALREFARKSKASKTFIGFGDPKFDIKGKETGTIKDVFLYLDELPESKKELETISKTLGQDKQSFFVQELATEKQLRSKNLFDYKVISFATHGLMAGEFMGLEEPALILTPQDFADNKNNGILYASEIAELKLDAQWVILSACNTAAPSGKPGAEGLSGLAKAFFYAGSRSLLVSNWMVETNASVKITTKIFEILKQNPNINKSQALRNSIINLRNSGEKMYLHPMFWAPFSIVGDGRKMSSKL